MKKLFTLLVAVLLVAGLSTTVFAFPGKVVEVDDAVVTIEVEGQIPPWVEKDAMAKTLGGLAKVTAVDGKNVGLRVKKSTAEKVKVGETIEIKPNAADPSKMLQGC